jgi:hypothetical protein
MEFRLLKLIIHWVWDGEEGWQLAVSRRAAVMHGSLHPTFKLAGCLAGLLHKPPPSSFHAAALAGWLAYSAPPSASVLPQTASHSCPPAPDSFPPASLLLQTASLRLPCRDLGFDPLSLTYFSNGEYLAISGTDK